MDLSDYERRKFGLAEILRAVAPLRPKGPHAYDEEVRALFTKLAEDRFNLVVVGRFSRGKSTLMNAIMGLDRLPTGIAPLTSVVTAVSYGSEEAVELSFEGRLLTLKIGLDELASYITQEGNPGNARGVKLAEIQLPAEILRRGFYFIDTPGLGSVIAENTETTAAFLPTADAVLLVTGFDSPLSAEEFQVLRDMAASGRQVFVALNKSDTVGDDDRARALAFVEAQLRRIFETKALKVFPTSALRALQAKLAGDEAVLAASGVPALEEELIRFLVNEKSRAFLLKLCDQIATLLRTLPPGDEADDVADRLAGLRRELAQDRSDLEAAGVGGLAPANSEQAGICEICAAVERATFDFVSHYQYDLSVRREAQRTLADRGGFCRLHTWAYNSIASPHGVAIALPPLLEAWAQRLADLAAAAEMPPAAAADTIGKELGRPDRCPVCAACEGAEEAALAALADRLEEAGATEVDRGSALCLPHLGAALQRLRSTEAARRLLLREAGIAERTAEDMRRYALKFDGLRRTLLSSAEEQSPLRALRLVAGLRNLSFAKRID